MILTRAEERAVDRAVAAYRATADRKTKGVFRGVTADQILEGLHPSPTRWVALASLVVSLAQGEPLL